MKGYHYQYLTEPGGAPLTRCPECDTPLFGVEGSVSITLSVGGRVVDVPSTLDAAGRLADTVDAAVAHGHHACTACAGCGVLLCDAACELQFHDGRRTDA